MEPKIKKIIISLLILIGIVAIFTLGRISKKSQIIIIPPEDAIYLRSLDSIHKLYLIKEDSIIKHYKNIQKNSVKKIQNHKKIKDEIKIVEETADNNYQHLIDSLYSAR